MIKYATLKQAEAAAEARGDEPLGFCPELGRTCDPSCVCYQKAYGIGQSENSSRDSEILYYFIRPAYCTHPMISAYIDVNS